MSDDARIQVLIVDDEEYVREHLRELLSERSSVETVSEATHGSEAIEVIESDDPDLVFLDVKMPKMSGIEVVEEVGSDSMPATVFVTAYDEYAIQAFNLAAIDYLLKPFDEERFDTAFERACRVIELEHVENLASRFRALLDASGTRATPFRNGIPENGTKNGTNGRAGEKSPGEYLKRLTVEVRGQIHVVPVEEIRFVTAEDTYVRIHTDERDYLLRKRLYEMEEQLDPAEFVRIHRSTIVRLDCVHRLLQRTPGDYVVQLDDTKTLSVSRSRQEELIDRLEMGTTA
jgi:Response regulator of the LytR/AlgR family